MKIFVVLRAEYTDYSAPYAYNNVVAVKYRESHAKDAVEQLKKEDGEEYYYEEIYISLGDIPTISDGQFRTLMDVEAYNAGEQLNEIVIAARIQEIADLKEELRKLKKVVTYERTRADRAESIRAKSDQELRTIRNTIKAAKKLERPRFLGFEDEYGQKYEVDPSNNGRVFFTIGTSKFNISIGDLRKKVKELKPLYEAMPEK